MPIIVKITGKVGDALKVDKLSLTNNLTRFVCIGVEFGLDLAKVPCIRILLYNKDAKPKIVRLDLRYERLPYFCYHYDCLMHETKNCKFSYGINVGFSRRHENFGEWLRVYLNEYLGAYYEHSWCKSKSKRC